MACLETIRIGDVGTILRVSITDDDGVIVDISTATTKQIILKKPDTSILTKTASFFTDGTDGILTYTLIAGDIDQVGRWQIEAYVVTPTGSWSSTIEAFSVQHSLTA